MNELRSLLDLLAILIAIGAGAYVGRWFLRRLDR